MFCTLGLIFLGTVYAAEIPHGDFGDNVGMAPGKVPKDMKETGFDAPDGGIRPYINILPPKNSPGELLRTTDFQKIDNALSEVLKHGGILNDRRCAIGVSNKGTRLLSNPHYWLYSGGSDSAPVPEIKTGLTGLKLFLKTPWALRGSVGVLSYDLEGTEHKLCIMWHVPFDLNIYDVYFHMKVYPKNVATNEDLHDQMYYYAGPLKPGTYVARSEFGVNMTGTITDNAHAKLITWIDASDFNSSQKPQLHVDCSLRWNKFGKYCWQEVYPLGWCWVNKGCSNAGDCAGGPFRCD